MTWGADVALYNTAVNALGAFIVARESNTPAVTMFTLRDAAQTALTAIVTPASATIIMPKTYPAL